MSTEFFNDQWRIPSNENQNKVSNYSMNFDASSGDTIQLNNAGNSLFNNATAFTISAWINPLDTGTIQNILTNYGSAVARQNVMLRWNATEALQFHVVTTSGVKILNTVNNLIQYNQWQHIVATYDGINSKIYYNGTLSNSIAATGVVATSTEQDQIGWRAPYGQYFNGKMDQVCVFDYALSATQVSTLYGGGTSVTNPMSLNPKPISYYQLGDQSVDNGANYLVPNNSLQDYVFQTATATSSYFTIPSITITSAATISIWVNIQLFTSSNEQVFFASDVNNRIGINKEGTNVRVVYVSNGGLGLKTTNLLAADFTNKWHHIALVQNGAAATLYIDNVDKGILSGTSRTPDFTSIGAINTGQFAINGLISNAALFSTNLPATGTESIESLYNNGSPALDISSYSGLQRWYKLNAQDTFDGTDWTIKDYAGSNDGTSSGMTSANLVVSDLQQTSGYSPYALSFDGTDDLLDLSEIDSTGTKTYSCWINPTVSGNNGGVLTLVNIDTDFVSIALWESEIQVMVAENPTANNRKNTVQTISTNQWYHIVVVKSTGSVDNIYINGANQTLTTAGAWNAGNVPAQYKIGSASFPTTPFSFSGSISNVATWNAALTSTQVTEIYNSGVPSNLITFSGTKPTAWWQLGSNSSFNPNPTGTEGTWTCLDEIGTNNAIGSANMTNDDITDGPGYSANGLGTSSIEIVGDAPYSTANGLSENMDVLDRTTDVPS